MGLGLFTGLKASASTFRAIASSRFCMLKDDTQLFSHCFY
jgi:hypothetical protein